jgi:hypothetical protein
MNNVRRTLVTLALVLVMAPVTGCTFGMFRRDSHDPALAAVPPCYSGDVCGVPFDGAGFAWAPDAIQSARR